MCVYCSDQIGRDGFSVWVVSVLYLTFLNVHIIPDLCELDRGKHCGQRLRLNAVEPSGISRP